ncbi:MAG: helix-turn-helix domain-containing protein [Armatimonadota bacterium]
MPNLAAVIRQAEKERELRSPPNAVPIMRYEIHLSEEQMRRLLDAVSQSAHEIMTTSELARYLKVSRAEVLRLARRGKIPGLRVGKLWRFKRYEVEKALSNSNSSGSEKPRQSQQPRT